MARRVFLKLEVNKVPAAAPRVVTALSVAERN